MQIDIRMKVLVGLPIIASCTTEHIYCFIQFSKQYYCFDINDENRFFGLQNKLTWLIKNTFIRSFIKV